MTGQSGNFQPVIGNAAPEGGQLVLIRQKLLRVAVRKAAFLAAAQLYHLDACGLDLPHGLFYGKFPKCIGINAYFHLTVPSFSGRNVL